MPIDYRDAQKLFVTFKGKLTRLQNRKDLQGIINLWNEFQHAFDSRGLPWPDDWRRWERAADDATFELQRQKPVW